MRRSKSSRFMDSQRRWTSVIEVQAETKAQDAPSGQTTYSWNGDGQLAEIDTPGSVAPCVYNARRKRVGRDTGSDSKGFLYDFEKLLSECDPSSGGTEARHTDTFPGAYCSRQKLTRPAVSLGEL